ARGHRSGRSEDRRPSREKGASSSSFRGRTYRVGSSRGKERESPGDKKRKRKDPASRSMSEDSLGREPSKARRAEIHRPAPSPRFKDRRPDPTGRRRRRSSSRTRSRSGDRAGTAADASSPPPRARKKEGGAGGNAASSGCAGLVKKAGGKVVKK
ncbi:unnamed protein product, partial [Ectocarpus sp. 12 AP-2014]